MNYQNDENYRTDNDFANSLVEIYYKTEIDCKIDKYYNNGKTWKNDRDYNNDKNH